MKSLALILLFFTGTLHANPIITELGQYVSNNKISKLSVEATGKEVYFDFTTKEQDGHSTGTSGFIDRTARWAFLLQEERVLWVYRGGDKVLSIEHMQQPEGPQVSVGVGKAILHIKTDRDLIPKALLEFIEKEPEKTPNREATGRSRS